MSATILHISGPPACGKTTLAKILARRAANSKPFFLRLAVRKERPVQPLRLSVAMDEMADCVRRTVRSDLVFEEVSGAIAEIAPSDRRPTIIVETGTEPCFRHAYPYDVKVFVMAVPEDMETVFRNPSETAVAIDRAMEDTSEFAAELFGLDRDFHDSGSLPAIEATKDSGTRAGVVQSAEEFLYSDVGAEIASRMQLQPAYHAIIDSDVILLNLAVGRDRALAAPCARQIVSLLEPLQRRLGRRYWFAACDLVAADPRARCGIETIEALLRSARI